MRKMSGVDPHYEKKSLLDSVEGGDPLHLPRSHTRCEGVVCPPADFHSVSWDCVLPGSPVQCFLCTLAREHTEIMWSPV